MESEQMYGDKGEVPEENIQFLGVADIKEERCYLFLSEKLSKKH
jgi:hypothetical protein